MKGYAVKEEREITPTVGIGTQFLWDNNKRATVVAIKGVWNVNTCELIGTNVILRIDGSPKHVIIPSLAIETALGLR